MSRTVIAALFHSIDGVARDPHLFQFDSFDDDLGRLMNETIASIDDVILGRTTYQEWSGYWPEAADGPDAPFAEFINHTAKHVASTSLGDEDLTWENSQLIPGDLVSYVRELKKGDGGAISVQGSLSVVRQLLEAEVLDELTLIVHPTFAGDGGRIFPDATAQRMKLLNSSVTSKGNVVLTYAPLGEAHGEADEEAQGA